MFNDPAPPDTVSVPFESSHDTVAGTSEHENDVDTDCPTEYEPPPAGELMLTTAGAPENI